MENRKKSNINKQILDKIDKSDAPNEVKMFIIDSLEFEHEHIEESRVDYKGHYKNLVKFYTNGD